MTIVYFSLVILAIIGLSLVLWMYVLSIYEIRYSSSHTNLSQTLILLKINCCPLNSLGFKAPFRKPSYYIEIDGGEELIESIDKVDNHINIQYLKSDKEKILIKIKSNLSLLPHQIIIN